MADQIVFNVETRYRATGLREHGAEAEKAAGAHKNLGHHAEHSEGILARFNTALLGYLGFHAIAGQVESLITKFISLSSEAELLQIQLAGMFQAGGAPGLTGAENFEKALGASSELIAKMRKDARELPGTFTDLMNIFQPMLATGLGTGRSINQIEAVASRFMAASASMHIPSAVAGHELESLLMGRANNLMPLWRALKPIIVANADAIEGVNKKQKEGLHDLEEVTKVWKQLTVDQRIKALMSATDALQPSIDKVAGSWETISSTAEDYRNNVLRMAGESPFAAMKTILGEINTYYEKNQALVDSIARSLGHDLADGLKTAYGWAKEIFGFISAHKEEVKLVAGFVAMQVARQGFSNNLGAAGSGGGGGGLFGGARGVPGMPSVSGMLGAGATSVIMGRITNDFSDLDKRVQYANDGLNGLWGGLSTLPGPIGQVATGLGLMTLAAQKFANWVDSSQKDDINRTAAANEDIPMLLALQGNWKRSSLDQMRDRQRVLRESANSEELGPITPEVDAARRENIRFGQMAFQFAQRANAINPGGDVNESAVLQALANSGIGKSAMWGGSEEQTAWMVSEASRMYLQAKAFGAAPSILDKPGKPTAGHKGGDTYNITINQEISEAEDADRVLALTAQGINRAFSHSVVSSQSLGVSLHGF